MIYVPSYKDYLANNEHRLNEAIALSKGRRYLFKTIVRVFFIADYGYQHDTEGVYQIMAGECAPLEENINTYIKSLS